MFLCHVSGIVLYDGQTGNQEQSWIEKEMKLWVRYLIGDALTEPQHSPVLKEHSWGRSRLVARKSFIIIKQHSCIPKLDIKVEDELYCNSQNFSSSRNLKPATAIVKPLLISYHEKILLQCFLSHKTWRGVWIGPYRVESFSLRTFISILQKCNMGFLKISLGI